MRPPKPFIDPLHKRLNRACEDLEMTFRNYLAHIDADDALKHSRHAPVIAKITMFVTEMAQARSIAMAAFDDSAGPIAGRAFVRLPQLGRDMDAYVECMNTAGRNLKMLDDAGIEKPGRDSIRDSRSAFAALLTELRRAVPSTGMGADAQKMSGGRKESPAGRER